MAFNSGSTLTGRDGDFEVDDTEVARCTQWEVNSSLAGTTEWGDSDSGGYTNRKPGRRDATFSAEGKYDDDDSVLDQLAVLFEPGEDSAAAKLYLKENLFWSFPRALCTEFTMTVDIDTEEVIGWSSEWGADGEFTRPGA